MKDARASHSYATLHELLILKIRALHYVESVLIKALPKMEKAASAIELKEAFRSHLAETRVQRERLEKALQLLAHKGKSSEKSAAIDGLVKDAEWGMKNVKDAKARDALLIAAAQYVEHYEMAGYGAARAWAEEMGHDEVAQLLQETLDEEEAANEALTTLAEGGINEAANDMHEVDDDDPSLIERATEEVRSALS